MPIASRPQTRRLEVPLTGTRAVVLMELRSATNQEHVRHMSRVNQPGEKRKHRELVWQARIEYVDRLLVNIAARDENGKPDIVTWFNPETRQDEKLSPDVPDWKSKIEDSWKCSAALALEGIVGGVPGAEESEDEEEDGQDPLDC